MPRVIRLDTLQQFTAINLLLDPGAIGGPVVIPEACKVMLVWNLGSGNEGRNVLYGRVAAGFSATATVAEAIRAALVTGGVWTALASFLAPSASLAAVELQDVRNAGMPVVRSTGPSTPGTSTGTELPNEVALCMTIRTALVGPGHRGRYYMPGWATNAVGTGNTVAAGAITAANNFTGLINSGMSANGLTWSLGLPARQAYTGTTGTQHPARAAHLETVLTVVARDNHWDSQRRRGLK